MPSYTLDRDEAVILQASGVSAGPFGTVVLVLTNKNLIQINKEGALRRGEDAIKYPLSTLKTLHGKANVVVSKNHSGERQLDVYFLNIEKHYSFDSFLAENKWAGEIQKAHKHRMAEIKKETKSSNKRTVVKSIMGTIDSAKDKLLPKKVPEKKTFKCTNCGAELIGAKGEEVVCSYCLAKMIIK